MSYRVGGLIDHVDLRVSDYEASHRFYRAILTALGHGARIKDGIAGHAAFLAVDELYVTAATESSLLTRGLHLCFQAEDRAAVARFHEAGLAAGGQDHGAPGLRAYHPGYYAAFLLDPDGNNIEAKVDERVSRRSATAIEVETR